jgi:hypothetical protein
MDFIAHLLRSTILFVGSQVFLIAFFGVMPDLLPFGLELLTRRWRNKRGLYRQVGMVAFYACPKTAGFFVFIVGRTPSWCGHYALGLWLRYGRLGMRNSPYSSSRGWSISALTSLLTRKHFSPPPFLPPSHNIALMGRAGLIQPL